MVAKYKSRRRTQRRIPPGGLKKKKKGGGLLEDVAEVAKSVMPVPAVQHDVHVSAHHPEDIVKAVQAQPEIEHIGRELLEQHDNVKRYAKKVRFPRWMASKPDRRVDLTAMAKSIYKKHRHRHMPKLGGGVTVQDLKNVAETVRKANDPLEEAVKVKSSYDKVNFNDMHSARGVGRNVVTGLAGNFHVAATHMKTANMFIPGAAAFLEPGAQGFSAVGTGLDKLYTLI